jgi:hypothetical protein
MSSTSRCRGFSHPAPQIEIRPINDAQYDLLQVEIGAFATDNKVFKDQRGERYGDDVPKLILEQNKIMIINHCRRV